MVVSICLGLAAFIAFGLFECKRAGMFGTKIKINIWFILGLVIFAVMWFRAFLRGFDGVDTPLIIGAILAATAMVWYGVLLGVADESNYISAFDKTAASREGLYGWARHPGFYSFILMSAALAVMTWTVEGLVCAIETTVLNTVYIIIQDVYWFEKYIDGYEEYKKVVPFLGFGKGKKKSDAL